MATPAPPPVTVAQTEKRTADDEIQGPNTRNKALRPAYNPEPKKGKESNTAKGKAKSNRAQSQRQADAIDVEQTDVTPPSATSGSHLAFGNVNNSSSTENKDHAMNQWLINEAPRYKGAFSFNDLPTSAANFPNDPQLEAQVQNVLMNTASTLAKGNSQSGVFPHNYVRRGPEQKRMGLNSLTAIEYIGGIFKIIKDPAVPSKIKPHLYSHMEELVEDAADYDWQTAVRPWSEEIFTLIAEGRLPQGWESHTKIQMLRMTISRASTAKLSNQAAYQSGSYPRTRQPTAAAGAPPNESLKGGSPCINYNSPQGCSFQSGHFISGKKVLHICAFCLWNSATPHPHPECYCRNKQRFNSQGHF